MSLSLATKGFVNAPTDYLDYGAIASHGWYRTHNLRLNLDLVDIVDRVFAVLPGKVTRETVTSLQDHLHFGQNGTLFKSIVVKAGTTNNPPVFPDDYDIEYYENGPSGFIETHVFDLFYKLAGVLQFGVKQLNEYQFNTDMRTMTGANLNSKIYELSKLTRKEDETDHLFYSRFLNVAYNYNGTVNGIDEMCYSILGGLEPANIQQFYYDGNFWDDFFWGDVPLHNSWSSEFSPFTVFIQLVNRPSEALLDELLTTLSVVKPAGTRWYVFWKFEEGITEVS